MSLLNLLSVTYREQVSVRAIMPADCLFPIAREIQSATRETREGGGERGGFTFSSSRDIAPSSFRHRDTRHRVASCHVIRKQRAHAASRPAAPDMTFAILPRRFPARTEFPQNFQPASRVAAIFGMRIFCAHCAALPTCTSFPHPSPSSLAFHFVS